MACFATIRGSYGHCQAKPTDTLLNPEELEYRWSADPGGAAESGLGMTKWGGFATSTQTISVKVYEGGSLVGRARGSILVGHRRWWIPTLRARTQYTAGVPLGARDWGIHRYGHYGLPYPEAGTGPWEGEYVAEGELWLGSEIYLHDDFRSTGPPYPGASNTCSAASSIPYESNVYKVNDTCGTLNNLVSYWHGKVEAHEREHEESLNACIANTRQEVDEMERLVGDDEQEIRERIRDIWNALERKYDEAQRGGLSGDRTTKTVHNYRDAGSWTKSTDFQGHGGTWGC